MSSCHDATLIPGWPDANRAGRQDPSGGTSHASSGVECATDCEALGSNVAKMAMFAVTEFGSVKTCNCYDSFDSTSACFDTANMFKPDVDFMVDVWAADRTYCTPAWEACSDAGTCFCECDKRSPFKSNLLSKSADKCGTGMKPQCATRTHCAYSTSKPCTCECVAAD